MGKTTFIITIDTEFSTHKDDMGIFGVVDGKSYGVPLLLDLLDKYEQKATFFVDVYTGKDQYILGFKNICKEIQERGHDLQLHTHPDGTFDANRGGMKDYSLDEQIEIIKVGKEKFTEWFGVEPIAHRAGDWAANFDTLTALRANKIAVDSSMFYGWPHCHLNNSVLTRNQLKEHQGILEIPASVYECVSLGVFKPFRLLSTDGNSFEETWSILKKLQRDHIPVITSVYHSFSFLKWNPQRTEYAVAHNRIEKFERLLSALAEADDIEVKTIQQIYDMYPLRKMDFQKASDYIPKSGLGATLLRFADRVKA